MTNHTLIMTGYALKGLKTLQGRDGLAFNATVTFNGKNVANASDDGNGGCMMIYPYYNRASKEPAYDHASLTAFKEAALRWFMESGRHDAKVKQHQQWDKDSGRSPSDVVTTPDEAAEDWINTEIDRLQNDKRFDRFSKTKTLFRVKGDKEGEFRTLSAPYSDKTVADIQKTYGEQIDMIYVPTKLRTASQASR